MRRLLPAVASLLLAAPAARADDGRERDLDLLVRRSTVVARAEVVGLSAEGADLHLLETYVRKTGDKAPLVRVRSEGERPMEPQPGDRGLFFLGPAQGHPGGLVFVQNDLERWHVEPDADAAVDAFLRSLIVACAADAPGPKASVWAEGIRVPVPALSMHAARRLAALARRGAVGPADWDGVVQFLTAGSSPDEAKAGVVVALADVLPSDRLAAALPSLPDGSKVKAAALAASGARASASGAVARDKARAAIGAASIDASPEVAFAAAIALAALGDEQALPALDGALASSSPERRHRAVEAMAGLATQGSRAARSRLHGLFEDPDGQVRARARQAWVDAYLGDPVRKQRTKPSLMLIGVALVMVLLVVGHSVIERRKT